MQMIIENESYYFENLNTEKLFKDISLNSIETTMSDEWFSIGYYYEIMMELMSKESAKNLYLEACSGCIGIDEAYKTFVRFGNIESKLEQAFNVALEFGVPLKNPADYGLELVH